MFGKGNNLWFATRGVIKKLASMTQLQGVLKTRLDCAKFIVQLFVWYWTCRLLLPFFVVFSFVCCFVYLLYAQRALFERVAKTVFFFCFPVVLDNVKHIYFQVFLGAFLDFKFFFQINHQLNKNLVSGWLIVYLEYIRVYFRRVV